MHRFAAAFTLLVTAASAGPAAAGTLRGTVVFPAVREDVDPRPEARKPLGSWRLENGRRAIAAEADVRRDVVLVLEPQQPVTTEVPPLTLEAGKGGTLEPRIVVAQLGVVVTWKNTDSVARTVTLEDGDTLLPPDPTPPGGTREVRFTIVGEYVFLDPEHPFVRSTVVVVTTPFAARTDERGAFSFEVPEGRYTLKAWWRGRWVDQFKVDVGPRSREPVVVKLSHDAARRADGKPAAPAPPVSNPSPSRPVAATPERN